MVALVALPKRVPLNARLVMVMHNHLVAIPIERQSGGMPDNRRSPGRGTAAGHEVLGVVHVETRLELDQRTCAVMVSGVDREGTLQACGFTASLTRPRASRQIRTFHAFMPDVAFTTVQSGGPITPKYLFGFHGNHSGRLSGEFTVAKQRKQVIKVVGRLLHPQATGLGFVTHPAHVVANGIRRNIVHRLQLGKGPKRAAAHNAGGEFAKRRNP